MVYIQNCFRILVGCGPPRFSANGCAIDLSWAFAILCAIEIAWFPSEGLVLMSFRRILDAEKIAIEIGKPHK